MLAATAGIAISTGVAAAGDLTRFELDDGSVIVGEALGLADGVYRIRTPALGEIDVEASRIRRMERATAAGGAGTSAGADHADDYGERIQDLQRSLVGDPGIMESIIALQQDPALQRALQDPELMGLITSGNVQALREHEGFGQLMNHPGVRAIIERIVGPDGGLR
ncbi:hypothetical protein CKO31_24695 [Thiohalocapsa halophila]|uniref:STI1 domain-containing protein n=1 Tax=Thiohalocapsa halophila TaxID=69359 RepID=A0ABS1CPK6_9GAMM|nr:hypothetical protein [Thiohalocapsa halophila]